MFFVKLTIGSDCQWLVFLMGGEIDEGLLKNDANGVLGANQ